MASEASFRAATDKLRNAVYECYAFDSFYTARFFYDVFRAACEFIREEPFLSILEHHVAASGGLLAHWFSCDGKADEALQTLAYTWQVLDSKDARRAMMGLSPSPSTTARISLLGTLAAVKWRLPDDRQADFILTPTQQVHAWESYRARLMSALPSRNTSESEMREHTERILGTGSMVATCTYRYVPDLLPGLVDAFNSWHSEHFPTLGLAVPVRHWESLEEPIPATPWYWHVEIAKAWIAEKHPNNLRPSTAQLTLADLDTTYQHAINIHKNWAWARANCNVLASLLRDQNWMKAEVRARDMKIQILPARSS